MKKLKFLGVWTAVVLVAGVLTLGACKSGTSTTTLPGAAIIEPFNPVCDGITSVEFTITVSSQAYVSQNPDNTGQTPEYAVTTSNSASAPTSGWQADRHFINRTPGTTYYIWARSAERRVDSVIYAPGIAVKGGGSVTTNAEGEDASVVGTWNPSFNYYDDAGTRFTFNAATPVPPNSGNQTVQYALTTTNDVTATIADSDWQDSRNFQLSRLASTQNYIWARTKALGTYPAGIPLSKEVRLPGATLSGNFTASPGVFSSNSATITNINEENLTKNPEIAALVIEYGLGPSASSAESALFGGAPSSGTVSVGGLSPNTDYYLWARTRQATNFAPGPALRYSSNAIFGRTTGTTTNAGGLAQQLEGMPDANGKVSVADAGSTVLVMDSFSLNAPIQIPQGVRLKINSPATLTAGYHRIDGGGTIEIDSGGTLIADEHNIGVPIMVSAGGKFESTASQVTTGILIGPSGVIELTAPATMTLRYSGRYEYILDGGKGEVKTGKVLRMGPLDTLTIASGGDFTFASEATLRSSGKIEVKLGGKLTLTNGSNFDSALTASASIVINSGAEFKILTTPLTTIANNNTGSLILDPGAQIEIKLPSTAEAASTSARYKYTLTGRAKLGQDYSVGADILFEVASAAILTVPKNAASALSLGVSNTNSTLTVNGTGTINIEEEDPNASGGILRGGTLAIGSKLINSGTINAYTGTTLTVSGSATINSAGNINIYAKGQGSGSLIDNNAKVVVNGTITVRSAGELTVNASAELSGSGTITVNGLLKVINTNMRQFIGLTVNTGKVEITVGGELQLSGVPYVRFTRAADPTYGTASFMLASGASVTITVAQLTNSDKIIVYTLRGNASLHPVDGTSVTLVADRFVISSGAIIWTKHEQELIVPQGIQLYIYGTGLQGLSGAGQWGILKMLEPGNGYSVFRGTNANRTGHIHLAFTGGAANQTLSPDDATIGNANWALIPPIP